MHCIAIRANCNISIVVLICPNFFNYLSCQLAILVPWFVRIYGHSVHRIHPIFWRMRYTQTINYASFNTNAARYSSEALILLSCHLLPHSYHGSYI